MSVTAFDLADRFQTPVFVASDLDIGMNDWMCKRLQWDDSYRPDRGKVLDAERARDGEEVLALFCVDDDGIAPRTLPGVHPNGAYFVRGSGHDKHGAYTEDSDAYQEVVDRLAHKFATAAKAVPAPEFIDGDAGARQSASSRSADVMPRCSKRSTVCATQGINADYMRIKAFPFGAAVRAVSRFARRRCSSSSRTATRSCARCSRSRPACRGMR